MRALVVGAGIAGLCTAYWLKRIGIDVVVIERSPRPRDAGFLIDLYGSGYEVARQMQMATSLQALRRTIPRCAFKNPKGSMLFEQSPETLKRRLFTTQRVTVTRGDLEQQLLGRVFGDCDVRFARSLLSLRDDGRHVGALTDEGRLEYFDLVVGAGGLHSTTRRLTPALSGETERYLGFDAAAFTMTSPHICTLIGAESQIMTALGRQLTISPLGGGRLSAVFVHEREHTLLNRTPAVVQRVLRKAFAGFTWLAPAIIDQIGEATDLHYDAVAQIALPKWSVGRIVLVGDASHCVSPLGLQGASLAMLGARTLSQELANAGRDVVRGLHAYEKRMRPAVERAQVVGQRMANWVAPHTKIKLAARDFGIRAANSPLGAAVVRRMLGVGRAGD
ncbi:MAG TPA: FAD-dependent oxidoreductase [Gemmatimonadaceae bacterium]|nr:FAD-dependent oxidoreductase [Gemmatimonadaceae bacterium]